MLELIIHRHTGGLEKMSLKTSPKNSIHRHTGGLENAVIYLGDGQLIHRHTGGLESLPDGL